MPHIFEGHAEFRFKLPRSTLEVVCNQFENGNWKIKLVNNDTGAKHSVKRSLSSDQLLAYCDFLISVATKHTLYKKPTDEVLRQLKGVISAGKPRPPTDFGVDQQQFTF